MRPDAPQASLYATRDLTLGAALGALAIVLPMAFHALGPGVGPVFLPMYLPILAAGLLISWPVGIAVGALAPVLSCLLTGMPPLSPPIVVLMAVELAALAAIAGAMRGLGLGVWPAAFVSVIGARAVGTVVLLAVGRWIGLRQGVFEYAILSLAASWPGMLLLLGVVPGAVRAIESASLLGPRWKKRPSDET